MIIETDDGTTINMHRADREYEAADERTVEPHDPLQSMLETANVLSRNRLHSHHCAGPCERHNLACLVPRCEFRPMDRNVHGVEWLCAECREVRS